MGSLTTDFGISGMRYRGLTLFRETKNSVVICRASLLYEMGHPFRSTLFVPIKFHNSFRTIWATQGRRTPSGGGLKCIGCTLVPSGVFRGEINKSAYKGLVAASGFSPTDAARHSKFRISVGVCSHCMGVSVVPQGGSSGWFNPRLHVLALFWILPPSAPKNTLFEKSADRWIN